MAAAISVGVMYKSGRLKTCQSSRPQSLAAAPASSGDISAPATRNYPEIAAPAPASGGPGDRNGPGVQYPSVPAVQYPEVAPVVQYPVVGASDSLPPPPPYEDEASI